MQKLILLTSGFAFTFAFGMPVFADSELGQHMKAMGTAIKCIEKKTTGNCAPDAAEAATLMQETVASEALVPTFFKDLPADQQADVINYFESLKAKVVDLQNAIKNGDTSSETTALQAIESIKSDAHDKYKDN